MKILFCYKWKRDPGDAAITSDGSLKWFFTALKPSDDESAAIVCARQIAERTNGEITAVTIGDGDATWALARGAKKVVSVPGFMPDANEALTGERLAEAIKAAGEYDVILMGDTQEFAGVVPVTAACLSVPLVAGVSSVSYDEAYPDGLIAKRSNDDVQETLKIQLPALISVAATDSEKIRPTMKQMLMAKKMPVEKPEVTDPAASKTAHLEVLGTSMPEFREAEIIDGSAREASEKLLCLLREKEII